MSRNGQASTRSTDAADYQRVPRPVAAMPKEFAAGHVIPPHSHERAQLVFAESGVMHVTTGDGVWVVPPNRALWIPGGTEHSIRMPTPVSMRTLYIDPAEAPDLPARVSVVAVSPLLRELILQAAAMPVLYDPAGRDGRIMALILDEIRALSAMPLHLPMPRERRLAALAERILASPAETWTLERCAGELGCSERTLARLFRRETELSFGAWLRHARLMAALTLLARGFKVTAVALDCGYETPSAFTLMFRRMMGTPPSRYFASSVG
jgi:AraC-like DNA-binding protein